MSQRRGEQMVGSQLAGLVVPYSQEFKELGVDEALLRELSELTGGGVLAQPVTPSCRPGGGRGCRWSSGRGSWAWWR